MWRFVGAALTAASVMLMIDWLDAPSGYACSVGPDFNPVESSDVIVEGRFTGYEILPDAPLPGLETNPKTGEPARDAYVPIAVSMRVERVHRGYVPTEEIMLVDPRSLSPVPSGESEYTWMGSGGACGTFNSDPTGQYALIGLTENDDGTYAPSGPRTFFIGEGPAGEDYRYALDRFDMFAAAAGLPALGTGPVSRSETDLLPIATALGAFGAFATGGAAVIRYRRRRS